MEKEETIPYSKVIEMFKEKGYDLTKYCEGPYSGSYASLRDFEYISFDGPY